MSGFLEAMTRGPAAKRAKTFSKDHSIWKVVTYMRDQTDSCLLSDVFTKLGLDAFPSEDLADLTAALKTNVKLDCDGIRLSYKPTYDVRNYAELLQKLKDFDANGVGGMRREELLESYPGVAMDIERLESESRVFQVIRKGSKEPVYYYRDPSFELGVDDSLRGQWRKNHVKGMADKDLEKELAKADIEPMRVQRTVAMAGDEDGTTKKKSKPKTTVISVTQARSALRNSDTL